MPMMRLASSAQFYVNPSHPYTILALQSFGGELCLTGARVVDNNSVTQPGPIVPWSNRKIVLKGNPIIW